MKAVGALGIVFGTLMILTGVQMGFDMTEPQNPSVLNVTAPKATPHPEKYPIVRLHDALTGRFFCSGTVISKTQIATASHCVADYGPAPATIEIRSGDNKSFNPPVLVSVVGARPDTDQAILTGDFSKFDTFQMETRAKHIIHSFYRQDNSIILCGYPYGGSLLCTAFKAPKQYFFQVQGYSHVYPGMSGGPVIDQHTNKLIAVNTAATELYVVVSPMTEVFDVLGISQ